MDILGLAFKAVFVAATIARVCRYRCLACRAISAPSPAPPAYAPQYWSIAQSRDASGFSTAVSGILIFANTARVFFFFLAPFELVMLVQSLVVIAGQGALLHLCVSCTPPKGDTPRTFDVGAPWQHWWAWDDFASYASVWALAVAGLAAISAAGRDTPAVADAVGVGALGLEALMGVPQLWQNAARRSTAGLSTVLVASWVLGDALKAATFATSAVPWQFMACVAVQSLVDVSILAQIWAYSGKA